MYKLRKYSQNKDLCLKELKISCFNLIEESFNKAIILIIKKLGNNENNWIWGNFNIKHFDHLPFTKVPGIKLLFHKIQKSDGNRRTPKIATAFPKNNDHVVRVNSNFKTIMVGVEPENTYVSLDTGLGGKIFTDKYDNWTSNHEKGNLIKFSQSDQKQLILEIIPKIK